MRAPVERYSWTPGPRVFGVLNLTPDSFSDGGAYGDAAAALARARAMLEEGADVVDVGGESTRPRGGVYGEGYRELAPDEEIARIAPVVEGLRREAIPFSIDTTKAAVARYALERGAVVVNDTRCGHDEELVRATGLAGAGLVLMHNRGHGEVEGDNVRYGDLVADVVDELSRATDRALALGVPESSIAWDPGLGFAKTADQSMILLRSLPRIVEIGYPVYVGASRKSFLAAHTARAGRRPEPSQRLGASVAACLFAVQAGAAAVRVHDVRESVQALDLLAALRGGGRA